MSDCMFQRVPEVRDAVLYSHFMLISCIFAYAGDIGYVHTGYWHAARNFEATMSVNEAMLFYGDVGVVSAYSVYIVCHVCMLC